MVFGLDGEAPCVVLRNWSLRKLICYAIVNTEQESKAFYNQFKMANELEIKMNFNQMVKSEAYKNKLSIEIQTEKITSVKSLRQKSSWQSGLKIGCKFQLFTKYRGRTSRGRIELGRRHLSKVFVSYLLFYLSIYFI